MSLNDILRLPDFQPTCFFDRNKETTFIKILDQRNAVAKGTFTFTLSRKVPHRAAKNKLQNNNLWPVNFLCVISRIVIDEVLFCSLVCAIPQTIEDRHDHPLVSKFIEYLWIHTLKNSQRPPKRTIFWCDNTWHNHDFAEYIFYINKDCKPNIL